MSNFFLLLAVSCSFLFVSCKDTKVKMNKVEYLEGDMTRTTASIVRNKEIKVLTLRIETNKKWNLFVGTSIDNIDFSKSILKGEGSGIYPLDLNDSIHYYFQLVAGNDKIILSEQHLPMTGGYNFRDMGGIRNTEGKYVKWGKMFRSDDLHNLTEKDLNYLSSIPLLSVVDFRSREEIEAAPDKLASSVRNMYTYSIYPGNLINMTHFNKVSDEEVDNLMMNMNRLLASDIVCVYRYRQFFELLQDESNLPLLFHCSAGKDRTGMAAALFLFALGVDEETIMKDYLSSNTYLSDKYAKYISENPNLKSLFEVKAEYLKAGFDQIKKDHGSIDAYLKNTLRVDIDKMKQIYLY